MVNTEHSEPVHGLTENETELAGALHYAQSAMTVI